ncbi:Os07g0676200, partial [Oryza sativa Japonica Group]
IATGCVQDVHTNGPVLDETILANPDISDVIENEEVSKIL